MTGINVQPQLIIRRHNNRKRLFRLRNLTSLLRFLKFFTIYLRSVKHDTKCGWKLQRSFFFVGQYLQRGPCLISVLHIDCYQALTLLMHTHKQAQRQVSNRGLPSQSEWQDCFITFAFLCFLVGIWATLLPTEWSCSICLLVISMTVVESVYRICFYITCSCRISPDMFLLYILTYTLLYIFISKLAFSKYWFGSRSTFFMALAGMCSQRSNQKLRKLAN